MSPSFYLLEINFCHTPEIGASRGVGAVFGILATIIFPFVYNRFGLVKTAAIAINLQVYIYMCVCVCGVYVYVYTPWIVLV